MTALAVLCVLAAVPNTVVSVPQENVIKCLFKTKVYKLRITWLIPTLFLVCSAILVVILLRVYPQATPDNVKDFGVILGLGLTAIGTFCTLIVSVVTVSRQAKSAKDLEILKGTLAAKTAMFNKSLDTKTDAYSLVMTTANVCYRELENLAKGRYDHAQVVLFEKSLQAAEGSSAHLDAETRAIISEIVQTVFNLVDASEKVTGALKEKEDQYKLIWQKNAQQFGALIRRLQERAPFQEDKATL